MDEQTTFIYWDGKQVPLERFITDLFGEEDPLMVHLPKKRVE